MQYLGLFYLGVSITIVEKSFRDLVDLNKVTSYLEGLVFLDVADVADLLTTSIWSLLVAEGIAIGSFNQNFTEDQWLLTTTGGRRGLVMFFTYPNNLNIGKLALWRLRFSSYSWISDYLVNYANQH